MNKILILDIETTGFLGQGGSIVEIGIVELNLETGNIVTVFDSLMREKILTEKHQEGRLGWIFKNSDLTFDEVLKAPPAAEVLPKVQEVLNRYPLGCAAYNNKFDFGFLQNRGIKIKPLPCPMHLSTHICKIPGRSTTHKTPTVEEAFNYFYPDIEYKEKHRGLDDARHEAMIVYSLYQKNVFVVHNAPPGGSGSATVSVSAIPVERHDGVETSAESRIRQ